MKVVAFNGSPRANGNTTILVDEVLGRLDAAGIETEHLRVGGRALRGCTACEKCWETRDLTCPPFDDGLDDYVARMVAADGIILASPVYYADMTPELKALIDRSGSVTGAAGNPLRRKVGAAVAAVRRGGAVHTFDSINHFFQINEMIVVGSSYWNFGMGYEKGDVRNDEEGLATMRTLGDTMAWLLQKLHG